ncbi:MAG: recombinase family protein [Pseudonocardiales bacterium]|nr:recombinase family protein [Pseudonocardiales bacterium]
MPDESNEWATLDALLGVEVVDVAAEGIGPIAFYGRCSTEDNQNPETSLGWQLGNARKFVEPLGGQVVAEYFDIGQSRSVTWDRRGEASRLLADLKSPRRAWSALVVGEGTRCWFGNQFSLIAPRFAAHGVELWVPELGGKFDPRNPSHKMLMSVLGGMSESERQHVQARVRAAMDAQVVNEGRHQGGRAPYGYIVVDGGQHPNPRKAVEGYRLRVLAIDEVTAQVVQRIFSEYLDDKGDRAIAGGLNRDGIPCPSARWPDQNRHRLADGWQGSTVRALLENPRYTGYAVFGRWTKQETLLDPDDVAAGHIVRFRRSSTDRVVRSRHPAHPALVSVEDFTQVQLLRRAKGADGLMTARKEERSDRPTKREYLLRGRIRCAVCNRKMEASPRAHGMYYRCPARTLAPNSPVLAEHPPAVYVREEPVRNAINVWIGTLFAPDLLDSTVESLVSSQENPLAANRTQQAQRRLSDAETKLARLRAAIEAGVDPTALVEGINAAQRERAAARAELDGVPKSQLADMTEVRRVIESLGDVTKALVRASEARLAELYGALRLQLTYEPAGQVVDVTIQPVMRVNSVRVRGGT